MISIVDRLTNKPINIQAHAHHGDYIIYREAWKEQLWVYRWWTLPDLRECTYVDMLTWPRKDIFWQYQKRAQEAFVIFKTEFKKNYPHAKVISAKSSLQWDTFYFYFYCEERLDFSAFVREIRTHIHNRFFIYQVGARDMVRLHPQAKEWLNECGCGPVWCGGTTPLPTVEMENIALQSLEWRDIEKLKWRCWKLKCSIVYEKAAYLDQAINYPLKWSTVRIDDQDMKCIGYNMQTQEVIAKNTEWHIIRSHYAQTTFDVSAATLFDGKIDLSHT